MTAPKTCTGFSFKPKRPRNDSSTIPAKVEMGKAEVLSAKAKKIHDRVSPVLGLSGDVLIDQDRISIGIDQHHAARASRFFVRLECQGQPVGLELMLNLAHILEFLERLRLAVPARIERHGIPLEHALEDPDRRLTAAKDQPVLLRISHDLLEVQLLVEGARGAEVFDGEADGK